MSRSVCLALLLVAVLAVCSASAASASAPGSGKRRPAVVKSDLFKPQIINKPTAAPASPLPAITRAPSHLNHPKLPPIGGLVEVSGTAAGSGVLSNHRFAVIKRDKMQVALKGWIGDFFAYFEKAISVLTEKVKAFVLNTVNAFEDRAVALFNNVDALWTYFKESDSISKAVADLWRNTRCDICQASLLHIYNSGCAYLQNGICSIVGHIVCGPLKPTCDKYLCPVIKKVWLQPECNNIMSRLDAALLDKAKGTYSPLDNFNTLAVCKRIGFCRAMDQPFDGPLFQAVANQARALNQKMAETKNAAAAVAAVTSVPPAVVPRALSTNAGADQYGTYDLPGLRAQVTVWKNIQVKSPRYGKPYYMFWKMAPGGPAAVAGIKELDWLNKINGKHIYELGITGVLEALNGMPGTKAVLEFEDSGFFGSKFPVRTVTFVAWPVKYASATR